MCNKLSLLITARKRSLGQGNIFTPVCHSVHRRGVRGCSGGACVVAPRGGMRGCSWGGMRGCSEGCAWLLGGCAWLLGGHAWLLWGGHAWLLWGGMHGCSGGHMWLLRGGMCGFIRGGMHGFIQGGMRGFIRGGVRGFFSFFGYNEIRSMSGRYASYWNAFLSLRLLFCVDKT